MVMVTGLALMSLDTYAQNSAGCNTRASTRQEKMDAWHRDMAEFRARSVAERQLAALADSISSVQARASLRNQDFVLEADNITFKNGSTVFVNSATNFISVKGDRAVVQISPSQFSSGPNGVGGVTVDGTISDQQVTRGKDGRITFSMNVNGIGINAEVHIFMFPNSNQATATVYPNFNSNTLWLSGTIVPYENSDVFEGMSL